MHSNIIVNLPSYFADAYGWLAIVSVYIVHYIYCYIVVCYWNQDRDCK
jgi:hypothetical protein